MHRRGVYADLPQLAAGELGWALDEQRLFIGNGTTSEGAPKVGNTEILTSGSDINNLLDSYTFAGNTATPVATGASGAKVIRTYQKKLDDFASVADFGAIGDGITDDTDAINRAIKQLLSLDATVNARRVLYFPAGTYKIAGEIKLYPYTTIKGAGAEQTILDQTDSSQTYLARTVDSKEQTGVSIGSGGATIPKHIDIEGICFASSATTSLILLDRAENVRFLDCKFYSTWSQGDAVGSGYKAIDAESSGSYIVNDILFDKCVFTKIQYGFNSDYDVKNVNFQNCHFNILYKGIKLSESADGSTAGQATGPRYVRAVGCMFDNIDLQAIHIYDQGTPRGNAFAFNAFDDVGTANDGTADVAVIHLAHEGNFTVGNYFTRTDTGTQAPVQGSGIHQRALVKATLTDNTTSLTATGITLDLANEFAVNIKYLLTRDTARRNGVLKITGTSSGVDFVDNFSENATSGVTFFVTTGGVVQYKTTSTSNDATIKYQIETIV
jgi:hypothetical protein